MNVLDIVRELVTGNAATLNSAEWQAEALATLDQAQAGDSAGQGDELEGQAPELEGQAPELDGQADELEGQPEAGK